MGTGRKETILMPAELCGAKRRDGEPCKRWATRGSEPPRCFKHGGSLPHLREGAALRVELAKVELGRLAPKIVQTWRDAMDDPDPAVRLRAAADASRYVFDSKLMISVEATLRVEAPTAAEIIFSRLEAMNRRMSGVLDADDDTDPRPPELPSGGPATIVDAPAELPD